MSTEPATWRPSSMDWKPRFDAREPEPQEEETE